MDILQDIIKSLEKEEIKSYKLFSKRTHNFDDRKDIELFDNIKKHPEHSDKQHFKHIYNKDIPDSKYYRLKNKITDDLGVILANLNRNEKETEALHIVIIARILFKKKQFKLTYHYLKLAEKKAILHEEYATLEIVYELFIQLSIQNLNESPELIIAKREENSKRLALLQELENNFSLLSYKLSTTQNLTITDTFNKWIKETLQKTQQLDYVKNSSLLRLKVFQNICRLLLLTRDYNSLEKYLLKSNEEFEKDKIFNRANHDIKIQLYIYICNASFVLQKYKQAIEYAGSLQICINEFNKVLYEKYIFYYYNILVNNYGKTNTLKAIETLEEAYRQPVIKNNFNNFGFVLLNLAITHFDIQKYKIVNKYFVQLFVSEAFKNYDESFKLKVSTFELCNKIELEDIDYVKKLIISIYKKYELIEDKNNLKVEMAVLKIIELYIKHENLSWRSVKKNIQDFLKKYPIDNEDQPIINYSNWLASKI